MTQIESSALFIIKPFSVGRGDAPRILEDILAHSDLVLLRFRVWSLCLTTLTVLSQIQDWDDARFQAEKQSVAGGRHVWICHVGSLSSSVSAHASLLAIFGPEHRNEWERHHLRYQYALSNPPNPTTRILDIVVDLGRKDKTELLGALLF